MTPAELRTDVLLELQVIAAGDTPGGDDSGAVDEEYSKLHPHLAVHNLVWWNLDDAIPDEIALDIALLMAHRLSRKYGKNEIIRERLRYDAVDEHNPNSAMANLATAAARQSKPRTTEATHY